MDTLVRSILWRVAPLAAVLLLSAPAAAAPFLQYGVDAAKTGHTSDPGPATDDIAWTARMPGSRATVAFPLIQGDWAYVLESSGPFSVEGSQNQVHRFRVATGEASVLTTLSQPAHSWSSDGELFYVAGTETVQVVHMETGALLREFTYPTSVPEPAHICLTSAVSGNELYVFCVAAGNRIETTTTAYERFGRPFRDMLVLSEGATAVTTFVASFDIATGEIRWRWFADPLAGAPVQDLQDQSASDLQALIAPPITIPTGLAVIGDHVVATGTHLMRWDETDQTPSQPEGECFLTVLNEATGELVRKFSSADPEYHGGTVDPRPGECGLAGEPTGDRDRIFGKFQDFFVLNHNSLEYDEVESISDGTIHTGSGAAYDGSHVFVASRKRLSMYNAELVPQATSYHVAEEIPDELVDFSPILTDGTLYAMTHHQGQDEWHRRSAFYAFDTTGSALALRWRMDLPHGADSVFGFNHMPALGEGIILIAGADGNVTAIGRTAASPVPDPRISDTYPGLGEQVRIDLSASRPGAGGAPTSFAADWGDGTATDWQSEPVLTHTYQVAAPEGGSYEVRTRVRNDAGQTASEFIRVYPGGTPAASAAVWNWSPFVWLGALAAAVLIAIALIALTQTRRRVAEVYMLVKGRSAERFEPIRELGRGTFGVAQLARDVQLDRLVVLKQSYGSFQDETQRKAFVKEAQLAARVHHPNVIDVFEVLPEEEPPVMVLEYAAGGSLEDRIQQGRQETATARSWTLDILQGLAAIHAAGIVHGDLKPSNVLLDADGRAKVSDFGVARLDKQRAVDETRAWGATVPGTLAYMSPEQLRGEGAGKASDQFAAAAIAFRLFTGKHHAEGADWSPEALRGRILKGKPRVDDAQIPPALRPILRRALASDPVKRFPDVKSFLAEMASASTSGDTPK